MHPVNVPTSTVTAVPLSPSRRRRIERAARKVDDGLLERNTEIVEAAAEGATLREIADAARLSFAGVKKIIDREKGK